MAKKGPSTTTSLDPRSEAYGHGQRNVGIGLQQAFLNNPDFFNTVGLGQTYTHGRGAVHGAIQGLQGLNPTNVGPHTQVAGPQFSNIPDYAAQVHRAQLAPDVGQINMANLPQIRDIAAREQLRDITGRDVRDTRLFNRGSVRDVSFSPTGAVPLAERYNTLRDVSLGIGRVGGGVGGIDLSRAAQFQNPYQQAVIGGAQRDFDRQRTAAVAQANEAATRAGAFGGSRSGILAARALDDVNRREAEQLAGLRQAGFDRALGTAAQEAALREPLRNQRALADASNRLQAAGLQQQRDASLRNYSLGLGGLGSQDAQLGLRAQLANQQADLGAGRLGLDSQRLRLDRDLGLAGLRLRRDTASGAQGLQHSGLMLNRDRAVSDQFLRASQLNQQAQMANQRAFGQHQGQLLQGSLGAGNLGLQRFGQMNRNALDAANFNRQQAQFGDQFRQRNAQFGDQYRMQGLMNQGQLGMQYAGLGDLERRAYNDDWMQQLARAQGLSNLGMGAFGPYGQTQTSHDPWGWLKGVVGTGTAIAGMAMGKPPGA